MLFAALRDMRWRMRRLVIAVVSTGLIFAMTLVLTGLANGFRVEAQRTVDSLGVDAFVVKAGAAGPFLGATPFAEVDLARVAAEPGVVAAAPLATAQLTIKEGTSTRNTTAFGAPEHGPGMPRVKQGRAPSTPDEVAVSSTLGRHVGDDMQVGCAHIADRRHCAQFHRTGEEAQYLPDNRGPAATGVQRAAAGHIDWGRRRTPTAPEWLPGLRSSSRCRRPAVTGEVACGCDHDLATLLWIVAVLIVGSLVYLSALERLRDFAVFKAIGVPTRSILAGLALQAVVVALLAAVLGVILAQLLAPLFPMTVVIPASAYLALPLVAILVGLLASLAGLRRAVTVDPALAFGGP